MQITTQDELAEHEIVETLGLVRGNAVRTRHLGKDILAVLRALIGGEVPEYTKMLAESREQAIDRMCAQARSLGADGIVAMRLTTAPVMQGAAEILAYGTAVRLRARRSPASGSAP
ncbi:YbjQ family protein [Thiococcus pfennigii]|uniref:YbjQ family protein n=1 Tax=Thiococcus pfennigii TaxID=1057 RepID=UPI001903C893|nr:YbjQ family protein [Thiococcus pfennigii]MBK1733206.1 hypothetical protein [Thiococcus pfennigii]